jgi:hypothetical protein
MTKLPRHLAPWAPDLELFPAQIAPALGGMAARLAGLIGGWPFDEASEGEPNGYDGVARKGLYERLLASEWLLLDEMPDEFLRRAVSTEHLFLQRAYRADTATRKCLALFDAGPEQLGGPRIAHLALMIVLAERAAQKNKAEFTWAVFQDRSRSLYGGFSKAHLNDLLWMRSACAVSSEDIAYWGQLATADKPELWFVGGKHLAVEGAHHGASTIVVSEVLQTDAPPRLHVAVRPSRQAMLDLPPVDAAARLLRDPLDLQVAPRHNGPASIDINSNILFARDGRRLFVRGEGGTLITVRIPNSPRDKVSTQPVVFTPEPSHAILAVGRASKNTYVVAQSGETLTIYRLTKRGAAARRAWQCAPACTPSPPIPQTPPPLRPLGVFHHVFCFINDAGEMMELRDNSFTVSSDVNGLASKAYTGVFSYLHTENPNDRREMSLVSTRGNSENNRLRYDAPSLRVSDHPSDSVYYFGPVGHTQLMGYSPSLSLAMLVYDGKETRIELPREYTAFGVTIFGDKYETAVAAINADRTRIVAIQGGNIETLATTNEPVVQIAASDAESVVAFITQSGRLGICSCAPPAMLLHPGLGGVQ